MTKKILFCLFLILFTSVNVSAHTYRDIEIFDIDKGKIIKVTEMTPYTQKMAIKYLNRVTGIYTKFNPIPEKGYAVRIPLESPVMIRNKFINSFVEEVIIMFPEDDNSVPFLMIFEDENKLICFTFKGNTNILLKNLGFKQYTSE